MPNNEDRVTLLPADALNQRRLGFSVSDSPDLEKLGLLETHFRMTLGELARTVIIAGGSIFYGGHLQAEGITSFLIEELHRYGRRDQPLKVCLASYIHSEMNQSEIDEQMDFLALFGEVHFLSREGRKIEQARETSSSSNISEEERALSLTGLRDYVTSNTDARIVIGGKRFGFEGVMPGIFEEVIFAIKKKQPLYLAGGFGGATLDIIRTLRPEYAEWFPQGDTEIDERVTTGLEKIQQAVQESNWDGYENGLDEEENRLLAASYRPSEVAALVGKGMGSLFAQ